MKRRLKWFGMEVSCYRVKIHVEPVHQEFSVNQSTNNFQEKVLFSRKFGFSMVYSYQTYCCFRLK